MTEQLPASFFQDAIDRLAQEVDFTCCSLFIFEQAENRLHCVAKLGDGVNFIERFRFGMGSGLSAWVAQKRRIVHLPDIHRGSRHGHNPLRCYLSFPILRDDVLLGVLNLAHVVPNAFDESLDRVNAFSEELARSIRFNQPNPMSIAG